MTTNFLPRTIRGALATTATGVLVLRASAYDARIEAHGEPVQYWRGQPCPCRRIESSLPRANCPVCRGLGTFWPVSQRIETCALLHSRSANRRTTPAGEIVDGSTTVLLPTCIVPGAGDLVAPSVERHVVSEVLVRSEGLQLDAGAVAASIATWGSSDQLMPQPGPAIEALRYRREVEIEFLSWLVNDAVAIGREGVDYVIEDGLVNWQKGRGPRPGQAYTVRYRARACYILFSPQPVARVADGAAMPFKATAQRMDSWSPRADFHPDSQPT